MQRVSFSYMLSFILVLFLIRMTIPQYIKYILFPSVIILFIFSFYRTIKNRNFKKKNLSSYVFLPVVLVTILFFLAYVFTINKQTILHKDAINFFLVFIFFLSIYFLKTYRNELDHSLRIFQRISIPIVFVLIILGIVKFILMLKGIKFDFLEVEGIGYPEGVSLSVDRNFYSLACIITTIFIIKILLNKLKLFKSLFFQFIIYLFILSVILSLSRRGIIFIVFLQLFLIVLFVLSFNRNYSKLILLRKNILCLLCLIFTTALFYFYFIAILTPLDRNKLIAKSTVNQSEITTYINLLTLSQKSISVGETIYDEVDKKLWQSRLDSRYPYSGWAKGNYTLINKIEGENSSIVPDSAIAIKIDNKSFKFGIDSFYYYKSRFINIEKSDDYRYVCSIYVFVSNDFNGDNVYIRSGPNTYGFNVSNLDMNKRSIWQKIYISFNILGKSWVEFGTSKKVNEDSDIVQGYVLFAYPEYKKMQIDSNDPLTWVGTNYKSIFPLTNGSFVDFHTNTIGCKIDNNSQFRVWKGLAYYPSELLRCKLKKNKRYRTTLYVYVSEDFSGDNVRLESNGKVYGGKVYTYDLSKKGEWQKLLLNNYGDENEIYSSMAYFNIGNGIDISKFKGYVIFAYPKIEVMEFNPNEPKTYTYSNYTEEFPLKGTNSSIVPSKAKGCLFNKNTRGNNWNDRFYYLTTVFNSIKVEAGDSVYASVYSYVSRDFNGNDVSLEINGISKGNVICHYNLKEKGRWNKLVAKGLVKENCRATGLFFFSQDNVSNFKNLNGYVTFAYPELKVIKSKKISNLLLHGKNNIFTIQMDSIFPISPLLGRVPSNQCDSILNDSLKIVTSFQEEMYDDHFSGPRLDRWRYALFLYKNEYNWWQRLIGGGFNYTKKFAKEFNNENDYDYPHNPFLSVLLYSGVIGLLVYIWFLYKAIYYYWIYRKEYWTLGLAFGATFFFAFFSSNSPFEPGIFGVLSILPYFIHYYTLKEKECING